MNTRNTRVIREQALKGFNTLFMALASLLLLSPMIWMISTSFKKAKDVFTYPIQWIPLDPVWTNHMKVWTAGDGVSALLFKLAENIRDFDDRGSLVGRICRLWLQPHPVQGKERYLSVVSMSDDDSATSAVCAEIHYV